MDSPLPYRISLLKTFLVFTTVLSASSLLAEEEQSEWPVVKRKLQLTFSGPAREERAQNGSGLRADCHPSAPSVV